MSDEKIIKYYLMCTVRLGGKRHPASDILRENQIVIINKLDVETFFRKQDNSLVINDIVVGGANTNDEKIIMV